MRGARRGLVALVAASLALPAAAGPVTVYRDGPRYCPRDRPADAQPLDGEGAIVRARPMLPDRFCGPSRTVDGCDAEVEQVHDTFRVYFHQYHLRGTRHDWMSLDHTYVILDRVGNCIAHIPGTGVFERMQ